MNTKLQLLPEWLTREYLIGADPKGEDNQEEDSEDEEDESDEEESEDGDEENSEDESEDDSDKNSKGETEAERTAALKEVVTKERKLRREERKRRIAAEKALDAKDKSKKDTEDNADLEKTREELARESEKTTKLATKLLGQALNAKVIAAATKANFIDPDDALVKEVMSGIDYDQDDEDPSEIDIDDETVVTAVKDWAKKKPHLIQSEQGSRTKSGSKFTKQSKKTKSSDSQKDLEELYPSLR